MKYLIRSAKYFLYLLIVLSLIIFALVSFKVVDSNIETMFVHGYDSLWQMALIIAAFALLYPRFGYTARCAHMGGGEYRELKARVIAHMEGRDYKLEKEDGENLCFIKRAPFARAVKMWEDRVTFTRTIDGFEVEGLTKDVIRTVSALETVEE